MVARVEQHRVIPAVLGVVVLAVGVGLGFALPTVARLLERGLEVTPFPVPGILHGIAELPHIWSVPIMTVLGLVGAGFIATASHTEALRLTIYDDHVEYGQNGAEGWIDRSDVSRVYVDGRYLVFLNRVGTVRHRLDADALSKTRVADAFRAHDYPWSETDPYDAQYVTWIDGRPEFSEHEHALLRKLQAARKCDDAETQTDVTTELADAGLVTRERRGKTQVRHVR